jgi:SAM-dependent methyltransferase
MNDSLQKPPETRHSLALEDTIRERLGDRRMRLIKLWVQDVSGTFDGTLAPHVHEETVVLDAGCSRGDPDLPSLNRARRLVGCDLDRPGLLGNELATDRVQSALDTLPFRADAFDVVVCKFVVEHLRKPLVTFAEFWRVLRPGGVLAVLTPNRWSPFAVVSSLVPYRLKQMFKSFLFGGYEEDTFPALYRANSIGRLRSLLGETGFVLTHVQLIAGMWAFFIFNGPLARAVRFCEAVQTRVPGLRLGCTYILGLWQKPAFADGAGNG